jgi:hypothetical protein
MTAGACDEGVANNANPHLSVPMVITGELAQGNFVLFIDDVALSIVALNSKYHFLGNQAQRILGR